jgi:hypothetical protein
MATTPSTTAPSASGPSASGPCASGTSATGTSRCCELAAVSFCFRGGTTLFVDHRGQLGSERHLFPLPQAQLLVHNLRLMYGPSAQADLA